MESYGFITIKKTTELPKDLLGSSVFFILVGVLQAEAYQIINCCRRGGEAKYG
jgi:hypothetical protein